MSSEKFDERIRQKLDKLEPAQDAAAWARIQARLPESPGFWSQVSWKRTGIALYMVGTTAALVLLWWNQHNLNLRNQELDQKVQQLLAIGEKSLPDGSTVTASGQANPIAGGQMPASRSGQVTIPQEDASSSLSKKSEAKMASASSHDPVEVNAGLNVTSRQNPDRTNSQGNQQSIGKRIARSGKMAIPADFHRNSERGEVTIQNIPVQSTRSGKEISGVQPPEPDGISTVQAGSVSSQAGGAGSASINLQEPEKAAATPPVPQMAELKKDQDSVKKELQEVVRKDSVPRAIRKLGAEKRPSLLANLNPRIGLDFSSDFHKLMGPGLHAEFSLSPRFTTSIGFIAFFPVKEQFRGEKDFNAQTGLSFAGEYGDHLPSYYHEIEAIQIKTRVLEIPVRFRYFTPINDRWSWLIGVGTHFNISARQDLNCEIHMDQGEDEFLSYSHRPTPEFFHNLEFSTGLEYQNGGLAMRIMPFYQYNFSTVQYLDRVQTFGLNLGVYLKP